MSDEMTTDQKIEDAHRILRLSYQYDVDSVVSELREAIQEATQEDELETEDAAERWLHETVDSHQRVIYTGLAIECLRYCCNEDAHTEEFGEVPTMDGGAINWSALAYAAFMEDIRKDVDIPEWIEEREAKREEDEAEDTDEAEDSETGNKAALEKGLAEGQKNVGE